MKKLAVVLCNDMHMDIANANTLLNRIKRCEGYEVVCDYTIADIVIVITCAFGPNKMYSVRVIADVRLNSQKDAKVIVTGCLVNLNRDELKAIPGISVVGFNELLHGLGEYVYEDEPIIPQNKVIISEGCLHKCSYCVYPLLAHKYRSRPMEIILHEVGKMSEIESTIYITGAQETSDYGIDLYGKRSFAKLLDKIVKQYPDNNYVIGWFHPSGLTDETILVIAENPNVVEIMLHIQHVDDSILKSMNRTCFEEVDAKLKKLKALRPDLLISTEVIVGFPGETEEMFQNLVKYLSQGFFNDIAVASYEPVAGTKAATLPDQVSVEKKIERMNFIKNKLGASCYPASENVRESVIEEYIMAYEMLSNMPKNILLDRQEYNCIAGVDTKAKTEEFMEHLTYVVNSVKESRTEFDFNRNQRALVQKYTFGARMLFYDIIEHANFKEAIKKRAYDLLLSEAAQV